MEFASSLYNRVHQYHPPMVEPFSSFEAHLFCPVVYTMPGCISYHAMKLRLLCRCAAEGLTRAPRIGFKPGLGLNEPCGEASVHFAVAGLNMCLCSGHRPLCPPVLQEVCRTLLQRCDGGRQANRKRKRNAGKTSGKLLLPFQAGALLHENTTTATATLAPALFAAYCSYSRPAGVRCGIGRLQRVPRGRRGAVLYARRDRANAVTSYSACTRKICAYYPQRFLGVR